MLNEPGDPLLLSRRLVAVRLPATRAKCEVEAAFHWQLPPAASKNPCKHRVFIGGEGRNRTDECSFCRAVPYHLATPPSETAFRLVRKRLYELASLRSSVTRRVGLR